MGQAELTAVDVLSKINGQTLSVVTILLLAIFLGIKAFIKVWNKHDEDMKTLKSEYLDILKNIKEEHKEELQAHKESLAAQRQAHLDEKTRFFGELNNTLAQLVKELQISNEVRNKISFDMAEIKRYQDEARSAIEHFKNEQALIKTMLVNNSDKLSVLLKCDMNEIERRGGK